MIVRTDEFNNNVNRVNLLTINSYYLVLIRYVILVPALSPNPFLGLCGTWGLLGHGLRLRREKRTNPEVKMHFFIFFI